jgi:hypothetical protein
MGYYSHAHISPCGRYRYWLSRVWNDKIQPVCWIMLNPSTADHTQDDPTIRRCMAFARAWGAGGIYVVNLFAYRATNPAELRKVSDPVGLGNNNWAILCNAGVAMGCERRHAVVAAWGAHGAYQGRGQEVAALLRERGVALQCLGLTRQGQPRHPLYVRADQPLVPFPVV